MLPGTVLPGTVLAGTVLRGVAATCSRTRAIGSAVVASDRRSASGEGAGLGSGRWAGRACSASGVISARACGTVSRACGSRSSRPSSTGTSGPAARNGSCSPLTTAVTVSSGAPPS